MNGECFVGIPYRINTIDNKIRKNTKILNNKIFCERLNFFKNQHSRVFSFKCFRNTRYIKKAFVCHGIKYTYIYTHTYTVTSSFSFYRLFFLLFSFIHFLFFPVVSVTYKKIFMKTIILVLILINYV